MSREDRILPLLKRDESVRQILIELLFGEDAMERTEDVTEALKLILCSHLAPIVVDYVTSIRIPAKTSATITRAIDDHGYGNPKEQKLNEEKLNLNELYSCLFRYPIYFKLTKNNQENFLNLTKAFGALIAGRTEIYINKKNKSNTKSYILDMLSKPTWSTQTNPDALKTFTDLLESSFGQSYDSDLIKNFIALPESDIDYYLVRKLLNDLDYEFKLSLTEVSALCDILDSAETNLEKRIAAIFKTLNIDFVPFKSFSHEISHIHRYYGIDDLPLELNYPISVNKNIIYVIEKRNLGESDPRNKITEAKAYWIKGEDWVSHRISLVKANKIRKLFSSPSLDPVSNNTMASIMTQKGDKNYEEIKHLCGYAPLDLIHDGGCQLILSFANANRLANAYENRYFLTLLFRFINQTERELKTGAQRIVLSDTIKLKKQNSIVQAQTLIEFFFRLSSNKPKERDLLITEIKTLCQSYLTHKMGEKNFDVILDKLLSDLQILSGVKVEQRTSLMIIAQELETEIVSALQTST